MRISLGMFGLLAFSGLETLVPDCLYAGFGAATRRIKARRRHQHNRLSGFWASITKFI
jgi:hypothetical protein